jgi:hypothetical protein
MGQPGWGYGMPMPGPYWTPPPPPKPGVIPLRPLDIGNMFEGAFATIRRHWRVVLGLSFAIALLNGVAAALINGFTVRGNSDITTFDPQNPPSMHRLLRFYEALAPSLTASTLVTMVTEALSMAVLVLVISRAVLGRPITLGEACRGGLPQLPRMVALVILRMLIMAAPVFVGILPGLLIALAGSEAAGAGLGVLGGAVGAIVALWLEMALVLSGPALMLEKQSIFSALSRSYKLVRGSWWRTFGIQLLAMLFVGIIGAALQTPLNAFLLSSGSGSSLGILPALTSTMTWPYIICSAIASTIAYTVSLPMLTGITTFQYIDLRIRHEGLDVELARAAGIKVTT